MSVERPSEIPKDFVQQNQEHWRNARRGIGSRPIELPKIGRLLHERMVKTFSAYGLDDRHEPIVTASILIDNPKTPSSKFVYEERFPEGVAEEDRQNYTIGITRINEYATNYAAREFFRRNPNFLPLRPVQELYGGAADLLTYGILLKGTYSRMRSFESLANHNKLDYKDALLRALFEHDTDPLNKIVEMGADYTGYSDINGMAIEIGKKRFKKPDLGKWFDKLDANRSDGKIKSAAKNGILSTAALGIFRNPGVVEATGAIIPASPIIAGLGTFALVESLFLEENIGLAIQYPEHLSLVLGNIPETIPVPAALMVATALFVSPFVLSHEFTHDLSADETHMGLIPAQIISREVTPYKARLETKD